MNVCKVSFLAEFIQCEPLKFKQVREWVVQALGAIVFLPLGWCFDRPYMQDTSMNIKSFHNPHIKKAAASCGVIYTPGNRSITQPGYQGG
jgi:hypothetical protein